MFVLWAYIIHIFASCYISSAPYVYELCFIDHFLLTSYNAEIRSHKPWILTDFFQFEIIINVFVALSASFEYLCHGSTAIRNPFAFTMRGSTLDVRIGLLQ